MKRQSFILLIIVWSSAFIAAPFVFININNILRFPVFDSILLKIIGLALLIAGISIIFYCSFIFKTSGKGTAVPTEPPKNLVINGLYKYTRNPMYFGYFSLILGEFCIFGHISLLAYFLAFFMLVNIFIIFYEEPQLKNRFGQAYLEYCCKVPRWL